MCGYFAPSLHLAGKRLTRVGNVDHLPQLASPTFTSYPGCFCIPEPAEDKRHHNQRLFTFSRSAVSMERPNRNSIPKTQVSESTATENPLGTQTVLQEPGSARLLTDSFPLGNYYSMAYSGLGDGELPTTPCCVLNSSDATTGLMRQFIQIARVHGTQRFLSQLQRLPQQCDGMSEFALFTSAGSRCRVIINSGPLLGLTALAYEDVSSAYRVHK